MNEICKPFYTESNYLLTLVMFDMLINVRDLVGMKRYLLGYQMFKSFFFICLRLNKMYKYAKNYRISCKNKHFVHIVLCLNRALRTEPMCCSIV